MRPGRVLLLGLMIGLLAGCAGKPRGSPSWLNRFYLFPQTFAADAVQLEFALIAQPLGDPYLNHALWTAAVDEQSVPLDHKPVLNANGFRVGTLGASPPAGLQDLLVSPKTCVKAHRLALRKGATHFEPLGPAHETSPLKVHQRGETRSLNLEKAQFGLTLSPSVTDDGRILLRFEPKVQHGSVSLLPRAAEDHSGLTLFPGRPEEKYPAIDWELNLGSNDYVVIGGLVDHPETLGYSCFVEQGGEQPVQYVLVIRTIRPNEDTHRTSAMVTTAGAAPRRPLPLALQSIAPRRNPPATFQSRGQSPENSNASLR